MKCDISFVTGYNEICPESNRGCVFWVDKGCIIRLK